MSYGINLCDPVTHEVLNRRVMGDNGIRTIYGMTGAESIPVLASAAAKLGDDASPDYREPAEGNAKRALLQLLAMARIASRRRVGRRLT